jgi:hypothetical protein
MLSNWGLLLVASLTFLTALLGFTQTIAAQHKTRRQVLGATQEIRVLVNGQLDAVLLRVAQLLAHMDAAHIPIPPVITPPVVTHSGESDADLSDR